MGKARTWLRYVAIVGNVAYLLWLLAAVFSRGVRVGDLWSMSWVVLLVLIIVNTIAYYGSRHGGDKSHSPHG